MRALLGISVSLMALMMLSCAATVAEREISTDLTEAVAEEEAYLNQAPPGMEPQLFAPEIISTEGVQHCFTAFSPDGREVYWMTMPEGARQGQIMFAELRDGQWTPPALASFSGEFHDSSPVFSRDGKRLYFSSNRPGGYGKVDVWYVEKNDEGWGEPVNLGSPPNSPESESQMTLAADGTIYFVSRLDGVQWNRGIYRSAMIDGKYTAPEKLGDRINTEYADLYPYIAPDESYLIFGSTRPGGNSPETDLYISFKTYDGSWSEPQNMGEMINNGFTTTFPFVSYDGRYLFFNRFNESETDAFYWVDSRIIDQFRPPVKTSDQ